MKNDMGKLSNKQFNLFNKGISLVGFQTRKNKTKNFTSMKKTNKFFNASAVNNCAGIFVLYAEEGNCYGNWD